MQRPAGSPPDARREAQEESRIAIADAAFKKHGGARSGDLFRVSPDLRGQPPCMGLARRSGTGLSSLPAPGRPRGCLAFSAANDVSKPNASTTAPADAT